MALRLVKTIEEPVAHDEAGPLRARDTAPDALSNLVAVLELTADRQLRCSATTRRPSAATVKLVEDALVAGDYYDGGEPIAAFAWPLLLQLGGLAQLAGTRLELTPRGRAVLAAPSYQGLSKLWGRWLKSVSHDELSRIEAIKGQHRSSPLTSVPKRRAAIAKGLATMEPGEWEGIDTLLAVLEYQPGPLVVVRNLMALWRLYLVDSYYGSLGHAGHDGWSLVEARYALCVLLEYVATMGLIDVAYADPDGVRDDYRELWGADLLPRLSRYDGLLAIRVNELGAAILHDPASVPRLTLPAPRPWNQ